MKVIFRFIAVGIGCTAALFCALGFGLYQWLPMTSVAKSALVAVSLVLTVFALSRAAISLWSGPSFWGAATKRAEVCAVPPALAGWFAFGYYTSYTDAYASLKLLVVWQIVAVLVYVRVMLAARRPRKA